MNLFQANNITKNYANHKALDQVSIDVPGQSIFGLLGPNGAGKTTLIRIINMITAPDTGELLFEGRKLQRDDISSIGYLPEERGLYKKMKVGEQALYLAQLKGLSKYDATTKLKEWFDKFEIAGWWNRKVEELSKGMQQKVQFIVTVLHEPKLLIFDEPFSGFDPINVELLKHEILNFRANGSTIIFSTHNMASVEELCDHIALINNSKTILHGEVDEIRKTYRSNAFEIEFSGPENIKDHLPEGSELLAFSKTNHHFNAKVTLKKHLSPNELLQQILPEFQIHSFKEVLPTMNDIFITKVKEDAR